MQVRRQCDMQLTAERLQRIPRAPGVYTFTRRGVPLYVGKAADLRARLAAYRPNGVWKTDMMREATGLRIERTASELEALLLEAARISTLQPKYNVEQRTERSYLSILVTTDEDFPQVLPTRSHRRSGTYIGPFTSARAVRDTLRALRKVFPYRCVQRPIVPPRTRAQPEFERGGGRVLFAPARRTQTSDLGGGKREREKLEGLSRIRPCLYFHLGLCAGTCAGRVTKVAYRRRVIVPLIRLLRGETHAARRLLDPLHRAMLDRILAETSVLSTIERFELAGRELQRVLGLPHVPHRIEGYDISNLHGQEAVGSMVVAVDGEPDPSAYKRFRIRVGQGKPNDPGMLCEVLTRRLRHLPASSLRGARARATGSSLTPTTVSTPRDDRDMWPAPDCILVDGGKAQLRAAERAMRARGIAIPIVALAKRNEELYLPGERAPLVLPRHAPALQLLQRVRDEAHRFAIQYHRKRYRKRFLPR